MGRKKTRRLSAEQFDAVMQLVSRMSLQRRSAARQALVDGMTAQAIAAQYGWHRTAVHNAETLVWRMHELYAQAKAVEIDGMSPTPRGWIRKVVVAPKSLIRELEAEAAGLRDAGPRRKP
jgi:hypothetical protein